MMAPAPAAWPADARARRMVRRRWRLGVALYLLTAAGLTWLSWDLAARLGTEVGLTQWLYRDVGGRRELVFRRTTPSIDLDFIAEEPSLPRRRFRVRWQGVWWVPSPQTVDFFAGGDDRVALRIDDVVVIERNASTGFHTISRSLALDAGFHSIQVDYRQLGGGYDLNVQWAPAGERPRAFEASALFPRRPPPGAVQANARIQTLGRIALLVWLAPPTLVVLRVAGPRLALQLRRSAAARRAWPGLAVGLVAFGAYFDLATHLAPVVTVRENVIFSADTLTSIRSMDALTFREHVRQHPLYSLVTSSLVRALRAITPLGREATILAGVAVIGAVNCWLAYLILARLLTSRLLAAWLAVLYGACFANLALFSIPETYALSTTGVLAYLYATVRALGAPSRRSLIGLGALAGLAGLLNPPLLSLSVIPLVGLLRQPRRGIAIRHWGLSLATAIATFVAVNVLIYGPAFYQNYGTDADRYGALTHLLDPAHVATVVLGGTVYAVLAPLDRLTHHLGVGDVSAFTASSGGVVALVAYLAWLAASLASIRPREDHLVLGGLVWLGIMIVFYTYFNPPGIMLYSVQLVPIVIVLLAQGFVRAGRDPRIRWVALAVFSGIMMARNISAVYAPIDLEGLL